MPIRSSECPSCGAHTAEGARHCTFCRAPVATVRCPRCFHMNVTEALYCSGCGGELGLEPIAGAASLSCPGCKVPFGAFPGDRGALFDCGQCGAQFVEHPLLVDMLERREARGVTRAPVDGPRQVKAGPVQYVPCPVCAKLMNRKNFGGSSGVVVDICKEHGTWFDPGELPRVIAFVDAGGLARARARQSEEQAEERARKIAAAVSTALFVAPASAPPPSEVTVVDVATGLLGFLISLGVDD